jgi:hypothetical protein
MLASNLYLHGRSPLFFQDSIMAQNCDGGESNSSSVRGGAGPSGPQDPGGRNQATGWRDPGAYRGSRPAYMAQSGGYKEKNSR